MPCQVSFASGKRSLEETTALKQQIAQQQKQQELALAQMHMIQTQVRPRVLFVMFAFLCLHLLCSARLWLVLMTLLPAAFACLCL